MSGRTLLRARWVFPVAGDPLADAVVEIADGRIVAVGRDIAGPAVDLGNVALLPGLVNAHTHLEFSRLTAPLGSPGMAMGDWVDRVIAYRHEQFADLPGAVREGLRQSASHGVTAVGEIAQPGWSAAEIAAGGLRTHAFLELLAPTPAWAPVAEAALRTHVERLAACDPARIKLGLSPHAPHTVVPPLLDEAVRVAAELGMSVAMHLAETAEEVQFLRDGSGPIQRSKAERGTWAPALFPVGRRPLDFLRMLSAAPRALVIHGNYLDAEEIAFLGQHRRRMSIVYCPRTHAFFEHPAWPLDQMLAAGVQVALGTDSRASSPDLDLLAELRLVARQFPQVDRRELLAMATRNGAAALGWGDEIGTLEPGRAADLAVVPLPETAGDPYDLLLNSDRPALQ